MIAGSVAVTDWALHDPLRNVRRARAGPHASRPLYVNGVPAWLLQGAGREPGLSRRR